MLQQPQSCHGFAKLSQMTVRPIGMSFPLPEVEGIKGEGHIRHLKSAFCSLWAEAEVALAFGPRLNLVGAGLVDVGEWTGNVGRGLQGVAGRPLNC